MKRIRVQTSVPSTGTSQKGLWGSAVHPVQLPAEGLDGPGIGKPRLVQIGVIPTPEAGGQRALPGRCTGSFIPAPHHHPIASPPPLPPHTAPSPKLYV